MKQLVMLYFANVHSILSYCITIYGRGNSGNLEKLSRLQRRILKIIFSNKMTDATYIHADFHEIMKQYKICSPKNMLKLQTLLLAHRIIYDADNLPCFLRDKYSCKKEIGLRNKLDFVTPYYRTNFGQRSINFCLAKEWNCL